MNVAQRFVDSLTRRGLRRTAQTALSISEDYLFDFRHRTDTARRIRLRSLLFVSPNKQEAKDYIPTRGRAFRKLLDSLSLPKNSVFVDFGCGKGKLLLLASRYRFKRIVGIEFSPELAEIAKQNAARFETLSRERAIGTCSIEVVCCDAAEYKFRDNENVLFFFNPFSSSVMSQVLANIERSFERKPREMWLLYNDPSCRDLIDGHTHFQQTGTYIYGGHDFLIFARNRDTQSSFPERTVPVVPR